MKGLKKDFLLNDHLPSSRISQICSIEWLVKLTALIQFSENSALGSHTPTFPVNLPENRQFTYFQMVAHRVPRILWYISIDSG